uniref:Uncharacterized protein n=1 Tax=Gracilaria firma TaxID=2510791 RepID=A0A1P8D6K7_9FLOR|nr:hypothetical protein [Gracilaria firma]APR74441.1 hypothetical protein [Gracilaria firma]
MRKMLSFFLEHQDMFIDFDFVPIISQSYNTINSIKIRRSKLILI